MSRVVSTSLPSIDDIEEDVGEIHNGNTMPALGYRNCFTGPVERILTKSPSVLVVDDEAFNQIVLDQLFGRLSLTIAIVSSPEEALLSIRNQAIQNPYDLLIVDYDMPQMSGPELIQTVRQFELNEGVPRAIIFGHTAFGQQERDEMLKSGADDILKKPTSLPGLKSLLGLYGLIPLS
eukprot:CAMPEP_0114987346 /NCGR_PEP_ID=MMETSP0216-20121206/8957_1 /TAXON_ID=223996 /ORGANISM="Protocruzia adherens, Strain Boccale" /LENGTH=177 /DNA_ID=CAMNT_0002349935 /DNA_START=378 /DNA_END=908 /DNA_ORIENTATION=-